MSKSKKKLTAKKLVRGMQQFARDLKAGKPLKVTRVVQAKEFGIWLKGHETDLLPYAHRATKEEALEFRGCFPRCVIRPLTITYSMKGVLRGQK